MSSTLGIAIHDRALAVARDGRLVSIAPSIVRRSGAEAGSAATGWLRSRPAEVSARHWAEIAEGRGSAEAALALARAELRVRLTEALANLDEPIESTWVAVGATFPASALSGLLAVLRSLAAPVSGFVDAAVATVSALELDRPALVLEFGLQHYAVTAVEGGATIRRRRVVAGRTGGLHELQQSWMDLVSSAFVRRSRFDPLDDALSEQRLYDALPGLISRLATNDVVNVELEAPDGAVHSVELAREQFVAAASVRYRELERILQELRRPGLPFALAVPEPLLEMPGLRARLETFSDGELLAVPDGLSAVIASSLPRAPDSKVRWLRRLEPRALAEGIEAPRREALGGGASAGEAPTHLLYGGRAHTLAAPGLTIGRDGNGAAITLPAGIAGLSRRHCTIVPLPAGVTLIDHSRHGTWVNGERVRGRRQLHAGDLVRIGEPGVELSLIAVGGADVPSP